MPGILLEQAVLPVPSAADEKVVKGSSSRNESSTAAVSTQESEKNTNSITATTTTASMDSDHAARTLPAGEHVYSSLAASLQKERADQQPKYGGPTGNGSTFVPQPQAKRDKIEKSDKKYRELCQTILNKADIILDGDRPWDIVVHNPLMYKRVIQEGSLGLGEGFMDGWWDTRDFYALNTLFSKILSGGIEYYFPNNAKDFANILHARLFNAQTKSRSKRVGLQHYDLGNEFFERMLGEHMQYSCAYWTTHNGYTAVPTTRLVDAQENKLHMLGMKLRLRPGMEVLDVGCGWGGLSRFLSDRFGAKVTGITISEEQRISAAERVKGNPNVTIVRRDYRDVTFSKQFDRIVSVGMFEHVGPQNYRVFFKHMRRLLKAGDPEAVFVLHTIGSKTEMESGDAWYIKYIFPGGCLPSMRSISKHFEKYFILEDMHNFGYFYGLTCLAWRQRFLNMWEDLDTPLTARDADDKDQASEFFRMFYYYLSSSAGAFECRDLQLWQLVLSPNGVPGYADAFRP